MTVKDNFRILLLVESLPNRQDPEPVFRFKNVFVFQPMHLLARDHLVAWPLCIPHCSSLVEYFYKLRGAPLRFPAAPHRGSLDGIKVSTVRYLYLPRVYHRLKARSLVKHIREKPDGFDLIHCHTVYDLGLAGLELRRHFGLPLVVTVYGSDVNWLFGEGGREASPGIGKATVRVLSAAEAVICVSRDLAAKVASLGVAGDKIHWVPNGVDTELFSPADRLLAKRELGWPEEGKVILYAGNLVRTKGLGDLLQAFILIEKKLLEKKKEGLQDFFLMLAGPDEGGEQFVQEIKSAVSELGLGRRVRFLGAQLHSEMPRLMRACDIFCLPSWREGWPLTVTEALACGRPVVGTRVGGIPELVSEPQTGILCPPRDPEALAGALGRALERDWDTDRIARSVQKYSYEVLIKKIEKVYGKVLGSGS